MTIFYSPVVLVTGAGCSVPYGFPDMRGFGQEMYERFIAENMPRWTIEFIARILYGTHEPKEGKAPLGDLEGLLVALTSISQYPESDNPAVSTLISIASEATEQLSGELSSVVKACTALTDSYPFISIFSICRPEWRDHVCPAERSLQDILAIVFRLILRKCHKRNKEPGRNGLQRSF